MAEGILRKLYGNIYEAYSAGTEPSEVSPYTIKVMNEIGIDISRHYSKSVNEFIRIDFDYVVTVCDDAKEICPLFSAGKRHIHKGFENPIYFKGMEDEILEKFREVRDEIKEWIIKEFGKLRNNTK